MVTSAANTFQKVFMVIFISAPARLNVPAARVLIITLSANFFPAANCTLCAVTFVILLIIVGRLDVSVRSPRSATTDVVHVAYSTLRETKKEKRLPRVMFDY